MMDVVILLFVLFRPSKERYPGCMSCRFENMNNNNPPASSSSSCPPHIFFPVDWRIQDVDLSKTTKECRVVGVGKTFDGTSFAAQIAFTPYFFVEIPMGTSQSHRRRLLGDICEKYGAVKAKCTIVERTRLLGFSGGQKAPFLQLTFPSLATFKRARYDLPKNHAFKNFPLYESNVDPLVRFFHVTGIVPASWVGVVASTPVTTEPLTRASIEVITHFRNIKTCPDMDKRIPPLILASWDIECFSADGGFPNADKEGDQIIQIGTTFQQYGQSEPYRRVVVCLGETATPSQESIDIVVCASEADVVNEWIQILQSEDADVMLGYNVNAFDWRYLFGRSNVVVDESTGDTNMHLSSLGKFHEGGGEVDEWELNTSAYGDNKFFALRTGGILQMDLIQILRKEYKLDSYSLNNVSKKFLGDAKVDLAAGTLFKKFQHGTSLDRAEIAVYCSKDCDLPLRLLEKLTLLENLMEMANACTVPMPYIINRGQNVKVASLVLKKARSMGFLCPDIDKKSLPDDVKFDGATVLNAERGAYFDCVSGLDFASLYPR
jgi:DNA polymerase delta subunit 1